MDSRRKFIGTMASGLATTLAMPRGVLGANDRIRAGIIGIGDRGTEITRWAMQCPNVDFVAFADIYTRRLENAKKLAPARGYLPRPSPPAGRQEHRRRADRHAAASALRAFRARDAGGQACLPGKDDGVHRGPCQTHARRISRHDGKRTVQVGHQSCSSGQMTDAQAFLGAGNLGKITAVHMHMYRNTPHGKPQWSRPVYPDMTPENILWDSFQGEAAKHAFDANRYINWRFFWDYSGGNVYENMCHQVSFWYKALESQIPRSVTMTGGLYLWKDGREVPDTMNVTLEQPEEMLVSWDSGFGNNALGVTEDVLGTDGTISKGQQIRYAPQKVNRPDGVEAVGNTNGIAHRAHGEFLRLHPVQERNELPVRPGLPRVDCVPYGGGQLSHGPHFEVGCGQRRYRLSRDDLLMNSRTTDRDPRAASVSSWSVLRCGLAACGS